MTLRDRILAVFQGRTPDVVPYMLDLSHWFYHRERMPWDLSRAYVEPERELIDCHRRLGAGFYLANNAAFYSAAYPPDVVAHTRRDTRNGVPEITWRLETTAGVIERRRRWEDQTYAWGISRWGVRTPDDLRVLASALDRRTYTPHWERLRAWQDSVGDLGVVYVSPGYSAMGMLLNYWMGVEQTLFAAVDFPDVLHETVERINANLLDLVDLLATAPAEVVMMGDNFSSDVQPPRFFAQWSRPFYVEAVRRLHAAGKRVVVHIDGRLRGALAMIRDAGADGADAVTPTPMGDLTPAECRAEAGPDFILSGGVSPELWLPEAPLDRFRRAVLDWLDLRRAGPRLIAAAGDQVPPGADESRVHLMRDLVEEHGRMT